MLRGLSTAAAGMQSDELYQQLLTNNLANAQTPGFKSSDAELMTFPEALLQFSNYGQGAEGSIGKMATGVFFQEGVPLFVQGQLSQTGRNLDVALEDTTPPGSYAATAGGPNGTPISALGQVTAGAGGQLQVNGVPAAVVNGNGSVVPNVFAARNPAYQGTALVGSDGKPVSDANGQPSYVLVNASGAVVGKVGAPGYESMSLRVGTETSMGQHAFYAVAYQSPQGPSGIAFTRDGHFDINAQNVLVDASGNAVLPVGANGQPLTNARIVINPAYQGQTLFGPTGGPVTDQKGQPSYRVVDTNGNPVPQAKLGAVSVDVAQLNPLGQTEFQLGGTLNPTQVLPLVRTSQAGLKPGEIERSNVDTTVTMTQMLQVIAQYEANQRVIQTEDTELGKAVTDVGKV